MAAAEDAFGPVSVLVNNAGIVRFGPIAETEPRTRRTVMRAHVMTCVIGPLTLFLLRGLASSSPGGPEPRRAG